MSPNPKGEPAPSRGGASVLILLLLLGVGGLGALHLMRPDLSPFDGRLFITVSWQRVGDLKPGAAVLIEEQTIGQVRSVTFDEAAGVNRVDLVIEPAGKEFCTATTRFAVRSQLLGLGRPVVQASLGEPGAPTLTHGATVEGDEGLAGKLEKAGKLLNEKARELQEAAREMQKDIEEGLEGDGGR